MSRRSIGWLALALVVAGIIAMLLGAAALGGRAYPWLPPDFRAPSGAPGPGWGAEVRPGGPVDGVGYARS